ncbi:hypothetical protein ACLOJK_003121 [Asimina triloba]
MSVVAECHMMQRAAAAKSASSGSSLRAVIAAAVGKADRQRAVHWRCMQLGGTTSGCRGGGQHDGRPGSGDGWSTSGDDAIVSSTMQTVQQKATWRQQARTVAKAEMSVVDVVQAVQWPSRDEGGFVGDERGRLASCGRCDQRWLAASMDLEWARCCDHDERLGLEQWWPNHGGFSTATDDFDDEATGAVGDDHDVGGDAGRTAVSTVVIGVAAASSSGNDVGVGRRQP